MGQIKGHGKRKPISFWVNFLEENAESGFETVIQWEDMGISYYEVHPDSSKLMWEIKGNQE